MVDLAILPAVLGLVEKWFGNSGENYNQGGQPEKRQS